MLHRNIASAPATPPDSNRVDLMSDVVYLLHNDPRIRREISELLSALGIRVITFGAGAERLHLGETDTAACVVLGLHLHDISGLDVQRRLVQKGSPPVIFISDECDVVSAVCAMKMGAMEFFIKPVDMALLLEAIVSALERDRQTRKKKAELATLAASVATLTRREREVLPLIAGGLLNKQAASVLGIAEVTLQVHRSQVMRKMKARSFADLVRMTAKLGIFSDGQDELYLRQVAV